MFEIPKGEKEWEKNYYGSFQFSFISSVLFRCRYLSVPESAEPQRERFIEIIERKGTNKEVTEGDFDEYGRLVTEDNEF
jgi:hypothetical protein